MWHNQDQNLSTVEATLTENCRRIKAASPGTRCLVYHNLELAMQALESQRAIMYDASKARWFVQYDGKNGTIYNEPGGPGDQFFFDMREPAAADWYIDSALALTADPAVDGIFTDDLEGFPVEHDYAPLNAGVSFADVAAMQFASLATHGRLVAALAAAGKANWQAFGAGYQGEYLMAGVPRGDGCAPYMRARCAAGAAGAATTAAFDANNANQSVAAFLISRGPHAWLGFGWESGDDSQWHPAFDYDVGEPQSPCVEEAAGVFSRNWTFGTARLDCAAWVASVPARGAGLEDAHSCRHLESRGACTRDPFERPTSSHALAFPLNSRSAPAQTPTSHQKVQPNFCV
jgi:hypothetical protein